MKKRPMAWHLARGLAEYCGDCDGCGWIEGGKTLQTRCARCDGRGIVFVRRRIVFVRRRNG